MTARKISCSAFVALGNERDYVLDCLDRGWLTQGKYVKSCEGLLASMHDSGHVILCSSGTAALHLALLAMDVQEGDGVLLPASTYVATANAVRYVGATPLFCDVHPGTWCLDADEVSRKARQHVSEGGRIVGTIPVHMYGVDPSCEEFSEYGWVLGDSAQAVGTKLPSNAVLSFYASKIMAAGEGGAFLTDSESLADRARLFRGQGANIPGRYEHIVVGHNYRITDLQAAVLLAQLESHATHVLKRAELVDRYLRWLGDTILGLQVRSNRSADWVFPVLLPRANSEDVAEELRKRGIETRPFFMPIPGLTPYQEVSSTSEYPVSYDIYHRGLVLPLHSGLSLEDVDYVSGCLLEVIS